VYLEAARAASPDARMALEQAGANQLLMCGQIEEGTRILRAALARSGRGAPESAWSALFWLIVYAVWQRLVGLRFVERDRNEVPPRVVEHLDALYAAVTGLALVDGLVGASLQARFLMASLRSGHGVAIGAAAALEA